ncbi:hypothetical protein [Ferviditalea candida]|uniref:Uncharacterized protein n=1 Tax=Ferviditalea candida TaxID=3108399 RepID=A0ABU5ZKG5_9BACL|nr:hypothetical protein [Paenibacillaceae bacterium T2]
MSESLANMKLVSQEVLEERLESVKTLREDSMEFYEIMKDRLTGEHYLHYSYVHINVQAGGHRETYHHFLPLSSDDVLEMLFGDRPYEDSGVWNRLFLRNGPEGSYVWFDPVEEQEYQKNAEIGSNIRDTLVRFKQRGQYDENATRTMLENLERLLRDGENGSQ